MDGIGEQEIKMTKHLMKMSFGDKWLCFKTQLSLGEVSLLYDTTLKTTNHQAECAQGFLMGDWECFSFKGELSMFFSETACRCHYSK